MTVCVKDAFSYKGASVEVVVETASERVCSEVKNAISEGYSGVLSVVSRHGGCSVISENPLTVVSADGMIKVVAKPANLIARLFWGRAVEKARSICS